MDENETAEVELPPDPPPAPPAVRATTEPGYRVVELRTDVEGRSHAVEKHFLPQKVYQRSTAVRWTAYEAKHLDPTLLLVLIDPSGRGVAVLHGGSGRPTKPLVALRAKRAVAELLPGVRRKRRTSRPALAKAVRRRTSKPARRRP